MPSTDHPTDTRAFRVFGVIGEAFRLLLRHVGPLLVLWAMFAIPLPACFLLFLSQMDQPSNWFVSLTRGYWVVLPILAVFCVGGIVAYGAAHVGYLSATAGRGFPLVASLRTAIKRFWSTLGALALVIALTAITSRICVFILHFMNGLLPLGGAVVERILIVAPLLFIFGRYYVLWPVLLAEGTGVRQAMGRSATLTIGHRWRIVGILLVLYVLGMVLSSVSMLLRRFGGTIGGLTGMSLLPFASTMLLILTSCVCYTRLRQAADGATVQGTPDVSMS